ncbi:MAG: alcohol dehydrogenase catalytic domain-containing protein [Desulfobacteraceae bacterium]|nr:alcohol dehydrogenase catalytic domain-containing protein [Desulfobacteraceae bacterium]
MRAVLLDDGLSVVRDYPLPEIPPGWARIRVRMAGICGTDLELIKGYKGFKGVLGHEFVGVVDQCGIAEWVDKRVVGEINVSCGHCEWCSKGMGRHCPGRKVPGILGLDGCMADYLVLPVANLKEVPATVPDARAVFIEPLSAACEVLEQLILRGSERVVVLGDGRLGILCAWVLSTVVNDLTLVGHHPEKLERAKWRNLRIAKGCDEAEPRADVVVEATGSLTGLNDAMALCRPRGTLVLKSTMESKGDLNLAPIVVNEITLVGSRCGQFKDGIRVLRAYPDMPIGRLITKTYPVEEALRAFEQARQQETLKIILTF